MTDLTDAVRRIARGPRPDFLACIGKPAALQKFIEDTARRQDARWLAVQRHPGEPWMMQIVCNRPARFDIYIGDPKAGSPRRPRKSGPLRNPPRSGPGVDDRQRSGNR